jgi:multimeric flavodoxin WrbA
MVAGTIQGEAVMEPAVRVVGLGGSLRKGSTSLAALQITVDAAAKAGASTRLFAVGELDLQERHRLAAPARRP